MRDFLCHSIFVLIHIGCATALLVNMCFYECTEELRSVKSKNNIEIWLCCGTNNDVNV
jgi:hypothetical protein